MTNFTSIPLRDRFETTLSSEISSTDMAANLVAAPGFTVPGGQTVYMGIDYDKDSKFEIVAISAVSGNSVTISSRAIATIYGVSATAQSHSSGAKVVISDNWKVFQDIADAISSKMDKAGGTFTGAVSFSGASSTLRLPNLTTAERNALTPANGMKIYNTTTGEEQRYDGGSWVVVASGGTFPNASETVAGKVEQATLAEQIAKTETGATGAPLFVNPKQISFSSSDAAQGKLVGLNASNYVDTTLIDPATAAQTNAYQATAGEAVDGSVTPQVVYISDGTGGRTAGRFYKADADDTATNFAFLPVGIINENASSVGSTYKIKTGIVTGFTGLTAGAIYYTSATAGSFTTTPANNAIPIGQAISTTSMLVYPVQGRAGQTSGTGTNLAIGASQTYDIYTGTKPKYLTLNFHLRAYDSAGTNGQYINGWVGFDGTNIRGAYCSATTAGNFWLPLSSGLGTFPISVAASAGANRSTISVSATLNANYARVTIANAISAGSGSALNDWGFMATATPY